MSIKLFEKSISKGTDDIKSRRSLIQRALHDNIQISSIKFEPQIYFDKVETQCHKPHFTRFCF